METEFFKVLAAGGDVGVYLILFGLWKLDKRISAIENQKGFIKDFTHALTDFAHTIKVRS